jgi:hypothetical protein
VRTRRWRGQGRMVARRGTAGVRQAAAEASSRGGSTTAPATCPWTPLRWLQVHH